MRVLRANVLGMCFGVRDALETIRSIEHPKEVTIHGELVHNEKVLADLRARGFHQSEESRRALPLTDTVLITAHGISQAERRRLEQAGKKLLDTTCPLVRRAHKAAQELQNAGYHVLVIGKPGHVEVRGIVEDLTSFDIIHEVADVQNYPHTRLGIVCQTTTQIRHAEALRKVIVAMNPQAEIRYSDTICHPTKDHQESLEDLLDQVEAMVVVGGRNSNNTRQLVQRCRERGVPAYHVQDAADLQPEWFEGLETVGLTAGTSTLEETIADVHAALVNISRLAGSHRLKIPRNILPL